MIKITFEGPTAKKASFLFSFTHMFQIVKDQIIDIGRFQRCLLANRFSSNPFAINIVPSPDEAWSRRDYELGAVLTNIVKVWLTIVPVGKLENKRVNKYKAYKST